MADTSPPSNLADDLLYGANAIGRYLFGPDDPYRSRKRTYHLVATGAIPTFRLGAAICARRSTLVRCIEEREGRAV
jgi:hypothetical protein